MVDSIHRLEFYVDRKQQEFSCISSCLHHLQLVCIHFHLQIISYHCFQIVNAKLISFIVLTALFGMHFFGVKQAARLQNILCAILAIAIAAYIVLGIGNVQGDYLTNGFMTKGIGGFVLASIYLTFAAGVVSLKRLLNQSNLKSWSSKMIKKSLEAYFLP